MFCFILCFNNSKCWCVLKVFCLLALICINSFCNSAKKEKTLSADQNQQWLADAVLLPFHTYWHGTLRRVAPASCLVSSWLLLLLWLCVQRVSVVFVVIYDRSVFSGTVVSFCTASSYSSKAPGEMSTSLRSSTTGGRANTLRMFVS